MLVLLAINKSVRPSSCLFTPKGNTAQATVLIQRIHCFGTLGLKYDDLLAEESPLVKEALRRLEIAEPRQVYDRAYRIRVAMQCSLSHTLLPKDQWTTQESVRDTSRRSEFTHVFSVL
jgi:hypothetical protein